MYILRLCATPGTIPLETSRHGSIDAVKHQISRQPDVQTPSTKFEEIPLASLTMTMDSSAVPTGSSKRQSVGARTRGMDQGRKQQCCRRPASVHSRLTALGCGCCKACTRYPCPSSKCHCLSPLTHVYTASHRSMQLTVEMVPCRVCLDIVGSRGVSLNCLITRPASCCQCDRDTALRQVSGDR